MKSMYIGSGDVGALLMGKNTEGHKMFLKRFCSDEIPYYNAKNSPIDALRIGAILEERYALILDESYYCQFKAVCSGMDVFKCSIDFAKLESGKIVDFDEMKTVFFNDFLDFEPIKNDNTALLEYVKKNYKHYYNQVQEQLMCTGLNSCNIVFVAVFSYIDEENYNRNILPNEYLKVRISRDEKVISQIKERGQIFQALKDFYNQ